MSDTDEPKAGGAEATQTPAPPRVPLPPRTAPPRPAHEAPEEERGTSPRGLFTFGACAVLAVLLGLVGTSAAPAIAREMGLTEVQVVRRDFEKSSPVGRAGVDAVRDFERDIGQSIERLDRGSDREDGQRPQYVLSKRDTRLRKSPTSKSADGPSVPTGAPLLVIRREGSWFNVLHQSDDGDFETGWIEVRDLEMP